MSRFPVAVVLLILLTSCRPEEVPLSPDLPPTPVLTSGSSWGVARLPYLKMMRTTDSSSDVAGLLRAGDVVEIISKVGNPDGRSYWLEIRSDDALGWVPDTSLDVYDSRAQATTASAEMGN